MNNRRAASLVELLLVMSACTFILTLSAGLIHRVMHAQSRTRSFCDRERNALRLAYVFRSDVHQASTISADSAMLDENELARLDIEGNVVTYLADQGKIVRLLSQKGKSTSREDFLFTADAKPVVRQDASGLVILTLLPAPEETKKSDGETRKRPFVSPFSLEIAALPARDLPAKAAKARLEAAP